MDRVEPAGRREDPGSGPDARSDGDGDADPADEMHPGYFTTHFRD
jgi:hypothetical protein